MCNSYPHPQKGAYLTWYIPYIMQKGTKHNAETRAKIAKGVSKHWDKIPYAKRSTFMKRIAGAKKKNKV